MNNRLVDCGSSSSGMVCSCHSTPFRSSIIKLDDAVCMMRPPGPNQAALHAYRTEKGDSCALAFSGSKPARPDDKWPQAHSQGMAMMAFNLFINHSGRYPLLLRDALSSCHRAFFSTFEHANLGRHRSRWGLHAFFFSSCPCLCFLSYYYTMIFSGFRCQPRWMNQTKQCYPDLCTSLSSRWLQNCK